MKTQWKHFISAFILVTGIISQSLAADNGRSASPGHPARDQKTFVVPVTGTIKIGNQSLFYWLEDAIASSSADDYHYQVTKHFYIHFDQPLPFNANVSWIVEYSDNHGGFSQYPESTSIFAGSQTYYLGTYTTWHDIYEDDYYSTRTVYLTGVN